MFCTKCGFNLPEDVKFCPNCGTTVANEQNTQQNTYQEPQFYQSDVIDEDVKMLVGTNQEYYVPKFSLMKQLNKKTTWNWPAFLFAPAWFFYRKMYAYGMILLLFNITIGSLLNVVLSLAVGAVIAVFANYAYMDYLEKLALQMKSMPHSVKETFVKEKGGTSALAVVVSFLISTLISAVLNLLL